jgi:hypothetical protein
MGVERNKTSVRRVFEEGFGNGNLAVVDECVAREAVDRHDFDPVAPNFPAHLKGVISMMRAALPDLAVSVEDVIGEGDRVAARVVISGTHTGDALLGIPARGQRVRLEQFHIVRFNDQGQGIEHWGAIGDLEGQLRGAELAATGRERS